MAKYINNKIKSGRVAGSVFAVRFGEVIERAYNPFISNPKTVAQVAARAKLKLMSQLAMVMAPVIAIPRRGAVSARNMFVKINYDAAGYANEQADITLTSIKLTESVLGLPNLITSVSDGQLQLAIQASEDTILSRVVYCVFVKQTDNTLRLNATRVVSTPGTNNQYSVQIARGSGEIVVYAYGMRDNTDAARVKFSDMEAVTAETIAKLVVSRELTEADVTFTETRAVQLAAPQA